MKKEGNVTGSGAYRLSNVPPQSVDQQVDSGWIMDADMAIVQNTHPAKYLRDALCALAKSGWN